MVSAQPGHRLHELSARHFFVEGIDFRAVSDATLGVTSPRGLAQDFDPTQVRAQLARD
jgi:hypothetical protein